MALPSNGDLPNYPFPAVARTYDFEFLRLMMESMIGKDTSVQGLAGSSTDLAMTPTSGMSASVAAGRAFVKGDDRSTQGTYFCFVPEATTLTFSAAHASNPRIDRVVLQVYDADVTGSSNKWEIRIIDGTATSGATLSNLTGAASIPNGAFLLYNVLVPAAFAGPFVGATHFQNRRNIVSIPGRELGYNIATSNGAAGDVASTTVVGDGVTPVLIDYFAESMRTSAAAGTNIYLLLRDAASGGGTQYASSGVHTAGVAYTSPCQLKCRVAAFSGEKTFYVNFGGTGTLVISAAATYPALLRAAWTI